MTANLIPMTARHQMKPRSIALKVLYIALGAISGWMMMEFMSPMTAMYCILVVITLYEVLTGKAYFLIMSGIILQVPPLLDGTWFEPYHIWGLIMLLSGLLTLCFRKHWTTPRKPAAATSASSTTDSSDAANSGRG